MNTREDCCPNHDDDHGPQKRPASVRQIEAGQKQIEADTADANNYLRLLFAVRFVSDDAVAMSYQTMGQYRTALLRMLVGDVPKKQAEADVIKVRADALPCVFVCFSTVSQYPRRYTRIGVDNWDVHDWLRAWNFHDNIGDRSAVRKFDEALHVFETIKPTRDCDE